MDSLDYLDTRPFVTTGRFRNFRFSLPFEDFLQKKEAILKFANTKCKFLYLQEELSDKDFRHVEVFFNTINSMTVNAVKVCLNIQYAWGVSLDDVEREFDYTRKEDTRLSDGVVLSIGIPPRTLSKTRDAISRRIKIHDFGDEILFSKEKKIMKLEVAPVIDESMPILSPHCSRNIFDVFDLSVISNSDSSCYIVEQSPSFLEPYCSVSDVPDEVAHINPLNGHCFGVDIDDSFDYYRLGEAGYSNSDEWTSLSLPSDFFIEFDKVDMQNVSVS